LGAPGPSTLSRRVVISAGVPDELDTSKCLQQSRAGAILFVHNRANPVVPYNSARRLYDGYSGQKQFLDTREVPGSNAHFGSATDPDARVRILAFLHQNLGS